MSTARGRLILLLDSLPVDGDPHVVGVTTASPGYEDRFHRSDPVIDAWVAIRLVAYPPFGDAYIEGTGGDSPSRIGTGQP